MNMMLTITYRERKMIDKFSCIDSIKEFKAYNYFIPTGTNLYYFRTNSFDYKVINVDDVIDIQYLTR